MKTVWFAVRSDDWKLHAVSEGLVDDLVAEMRARGSLGETTRHPIETYGLDREGMCDVRRPVETFAFYGLDFEVPSEHVAHFRRQLLELPRRKFASGAPYFKLHCWWNCVVLTPAQRRSLLRALRAKLDGAEARAADFYRDRRPANEVLAAAAKAVIGVELPADVFGPDRQARFRGGRQRHSRGGT